MKTQLSEQEFNMELRQHTGTQTWFRHSLNRSILYTEGAKFVADTCQAYWLIDEIALNQMSKKISKHDFQVWKLTVKDNKGILRCENGNGRKIFEDDKPFTDFPYPEVTLWVEGDVILLPSEH